MVPQEFGESAPGLFRRLAVRNVVKVQFLVFIYFFFLLNYGKPISV